MSMKKNKIAFMGLVIGGIVSILSSCHSHEWTDATCTEPKRCSTCEETSGDALGHEWNDATCTTPKTCQRCNTTEGDALGHNFEEYIVEKEATCSAEGIQVAKCTVCGEKDSKSIDKLEHKKGKWKITKKATFNSAGIKELHCSKCGELIETKKYTLSAKEIKKLYKEQCKSYSYDSIAREPDKYDGKYAKFTGEVIQVMRDEDDYILRVDVTRTSWGYTDTIMVYYEAPSSSKKILEDDIVTMYGKLGGETTYTTVLNSSVTIPVFFAEYIDIQ